MSRRTSELPHDLRIPSIMMGRGSVASTMGDKESDVLLNGSILSSLNSSRQSVRQKDVVAPSIRSLRRGSVQHHAKKGEGDEDGAKKKLTRASSAFNGSFSVPNSLGGGGGGGLGPPSLASDNGLKTELLTMAVKQDNLQTQLNEMKTAVGKIDALAETLSQLKTITLQLSSLSLQASLPLSASGQAHPVTDVKAVATDTASERAEGPNPPSPTAFAAK